MKELLYYHMKIVDTNIILRYLLNDTKELAAACEGANVAGITEILIKDAHGSGRNIDPYKLPENAKLINCLKRTIILK